MNNGPRFLSNRTVGLCQYTVPNIAQLYCGAVPSDDENLVNLMIANSRASFCSAGQMARIMKARFFVGRVAINSIRTRKAKSVFMAACSQT